MHAEFNKGNCCYPLDVNQMRVVCEHKHTLKVLGCMSYVRQPAYYQEHT